jgi:adenosylcobyric acid synthase
VIEGAGSPAEINLKAHDIVNMRMADAADAACLLVGDIDRGGVFASLLGTMVLLDRSERRRIRGFAINKFRGDEALLAPGIQMIERRVRRPCMGVIPHLHALGLDEEDSVALEDRRTAARAWRSLRTATPDDRGRPLRVGVIALPRMANFTDFGPLAQEPAVELAFLEKAEDVEDADVAILPGTKSTLDDLRWLRASGFASALIERAKRRRPIVGICGGLQMLGEDVRDPAGVESGGSAQGLALLGIRTELAARKTTIPATAVWTDLRVFGQSGGAAEATGYEIHMGETCYLEGVQPFCEVRRADTAGVVSDGAITDDGFIVGTYLHGLFDGDSFRHAFIHAARAAVHLAPPAALVSVAAQRDDRLNRFAAHVESALNVDALLGWLGLPSKPLAGAEHHA